MTHTWKEPQWTERQAPPLNLDYLPASLARVVRAVSYSMQVPADFVLLVALSCASLAMQGEISVRVNPNYLEHTALYTAPLLDSGQRKSAVLSWLSKPLTEYERQLRRDARMTIEAQLAEQRIARETLLIIERELAKAESSGTATDDQRAALDQALARSAAAEVQPMPQLLFDDITPEALAVELAKHGAAGILTAEGGMVDILSGARYSNGTANLDAVLKAFSRESLRVSRRGSDSYECEKPYLVICLAAQPAVWVAAKGSEAMRQRGLLQRFLIVLPQSMQGMRSYKSEPIPESLEIAWRQALLEIAAQTEREISLSHEAEQICVEIHNWAEFDMSPQYEGGSVQAGWLARAKGHALRIAAALQLIDNPAAQEISGDVMRSAKLLLQWLFKHLCVGLESRTTSPAEACLKLLRQQAAKRQATANASRNFSTRDVQQSVKQQSWYKSAAEKSEAVREALDLLARMHWIRFSEQSGKSEIWEWHPDLIKYWDSIVR